MMNASGQNDQAPVVHIIDDDPAVLNSVAMMLGVSGIECKLWSLPTEFLNNANVRNDDIVLTDLRMPEMDGMELFRALRARGISSRIILMTGHGTRETMDDALTLGFCAALAKPFSMPELIQCLVEANISSPCENAR